LLAGEIARRLGGLEAITKDAERVRAFRIEEPKHNPSVGRREMHLGAVQVDGVADAHREIRVSGMAQPCREVGDGARTKIQRRRPAYLPPVHLLRPQTGTGSLPRWFNDERANEPRHVAVTNKILAAKNPVDPADQVDLAVNDQLAVDVGLALAVVNRYSRSSAWPSRRNTSSNWGDNAVRGRRAHERAQPGEFLEPLGRIIERPDDRLALRDRQRQHLRHAAERGVEASCKRVVCDRPSELEDKVIL
jgi:hypothetical protein